MHPGCKQDTIGDSATELKGHVRSPEESNEGMNSSCNLPVSCQIKQDPVSIGALIVIASKPKSSFTTFEF